ncbi:hypothetical protein EDC94DRAFT_605074 [Helicostylum pulchrum]|nr:hypothetical protein EDC94DRAFT_605074 [Helicostylum pulchrum]
MVHYSKLPSIKEPETGLLQFLFSNKFNTLDDKPMFIDALDTSRFLTYAQLKDSILRFGAGLQDVCGFKSDDVLVLFSYNQYDYSIPVLGAIAANGATTTVNPNYNVEELSYQLIQVNAKVIICQKDNIEVALIAGARAGVPKQNIFIFGDEQVNGIQPFKKALVRDRKAVLEELSFEEAKEKVAVLCFSSGTTGRSKGVMTTHANITANTAQFASFEEGFMDSDTNRMIAVIPLFHIYGLLLLLMYALYLGIPVYILPRFKLETFCKVIQDNKITYAPIVPPICLLLAKSPVISNYDLSSLKVALSGGSALSEDLASEATGRLPGTVIKQGYGLTETTLFSLSEQTDNKVRGSSGILAPNLVVKIVDDDGVEVKQGERGEIWIKGPSVMKGYINNPEATADCIDKDGYFHTGDIARIDEDGNFFIVDRKKELIKYKGFQVPPAELELILHKYHAIFECAVIGIYDASKATELPTAYVTLKEGIVPSEETEKKILEYVASQVVSYKKLHGVRFIDTIPRGPSGKILRRSLRDAALQENNI